MERIKTDRQCSGGVLCMWGVMSLVLGVAFCYAGISAESPMLYCAGKVICYACPTVLAPAAVFWALRNQMDKGARYMWEHYKVVLRLRKQLLDAGIYTEKRLGAFKWAVLPWITVHFEPGFRSGRVYVRNSIKFHDRLGKIDLSPSLGEYVVEQAYLTDDENHYYFVFYDSSLERRLTFGSFQAFRAYARQTGDYSLFVDQYTELTLTHQLLVGQTGSGKSYALHGYILQMLLKPINYHLYFADPKASSIALFGERVSPETTASSFDGITALLQTFVSKMHERELQVKEHLSEKIDGDYRDFGLSPHVLIFDEFADFSLLLQTKDKKQRDSVSHLISEIVLKGRQTGFFLWVVMQQAGSNNIPTFIRDNLPWKVVLGNAEDQTYNTAFGAGVDIPLRKMEAGEGVYTYPAAASKPRLCSFPTLGFDIPGALETLEAGVM